jgi:hypothetical protein
MDETSTSAMLVQTRQMFASKSDGLTVTVPRDEVEGALASEPPDDLVLDVLRTVEGQEEAERRTVNVAWKRTDLESLLEDPEAEAITFSFDPAELERILAEPEVEGHGLREAAAVLSIAAAAAAAGSASASAMYGEPGVPGPTAQLQVAASGHDEMTFAARGIESPSPADAATVSSGSRFDLPSVEPAMVASIAAVLGAFGLAILGASFVSRRREPGSA